MAVGTLTVVLGVRAAAPNEQAVGIGLLSPIYPAFGLNASVFYAPQPDLPMLKLTCYLGVLGIALGAAAWYFRADRTSLRRAGTVLLAAGLAFTATAAALDATARVDLPPTSATADPGHDPPASRGRATRVRPARPRPAQRDP